MTLKTIRDVRRPPTKEVALKAREITNNAFRTDNRTALHVSPADLHTTSLGWRVTTITKIPGQRARHHKVRVNMPKSYMGKFSKCPEVAIDCDCLTGDTMVLTSTGWREIREMAEPLTCDLSYLPVRYAVNGKLYAGTFPYYKGRLPVYKIVLDNGQTVSATANHRLLTVDTMHKPIFDGPGRSYTHSERRLIKAWKRINDLRVGDKLDVNDHAFEQVAQDTTFWEAYFAGVLMGDGTVFNTGYPDLQLYGEKVDLVDNIAKSSVVSGVRDVSRNGVRVAFNHRASEVMSRMKFENKKCVTLRSLKDVLGYVSGLSATDGHVTKDYFAMNISGGEYLRGLQMDLMRYGFGQCQLSVTSIAGTATNYGVRNKDLLQLRISGESLVRLMPYLHLRGSMHERLESRLESYRQKYGDKPKVPSARVMSISYAGRQDVYDITVPKAKMFVANGVIAHNCMRYLFVWNWALLQKNAALKDHTNGMPPDITNPGYVPGCCKHGLVAIRSLLAVDPQWPAAVVGHPKHPHVGKPVTLESLRRSAADIRFNRMTAQQRRDFIASHPNSRYAKLAEQASAPKPRADTASQKGDVNLATTRVLKQDKEI